MNTVQHWPRRNLLGCCSANRASLVLLRSLHLASWGLPLAKCPSVGGKRQQESFHLSLASGQLTIRRICSHGIKAKKSLSCNICWRISHFILWWLDYGFRKGSLMQERVEAPCGFVQAVLLGMQMIDYDCEHMWANSRANK